MPGISVTHKCFVVAAARTQWTRPAGMAIILTVNMAASQKIILLLQVDSSGNVSEGVFIGVDKSMAGSDIARGANTHQS